MDKKSLIFIVCLSAAFFAIQSWFSSSRETPRILEEQKVQQIKSTYRKETASLKDFGLSALFSDSAQQNKLASAVACGEYFLALSWGDSLPASVFSSSGEPLYLRSNPARTGQPVIYSAPNASPTALPAIPRDQSTAIQIITLAEIPQIVSGEYRSGIFSSPHPHAGERAIAFLRENNIYLPVGVYEPESQRIKPLGEFEWLKNLVKQGETVSLTSGNGNEEFYVLETPYQQLVFSTRGGSLAEINLPLRGNDHPESIVREIDIDREIVAQSPQNARFPLRPHYTPANNKELSTTGSLGGYYPLLRRPILNPDGTVRSPFPQDAYAFNIVSEDGALEQATYRVTRFEPDLIQFQGSAGQRRITKTFTIPKERNGPYCLQLEVLVEGDTRNLWLTSGVPDVELVGGTYSPLLRYQTTRSGGYDVETIDLPKKEPAVSELPANWVSNCNGFLGVIINPLTQRSEGRKAVSFDGNAIPTRLSLIDSAYHLYPAGNYPGYSISIPLQNTSTVFRIFAGPFDNALLKELDALYEDPTRGYNPEYSSAQSIQGWFSFISQPFSKFLFLLMQMFYVISRSWAAAIILLTIALRVMMYPLNAWSIRSSVKMQEIAPKVKVLQDRYKKDPKKAQMEVMNLYRESKINPLTGCLPMFLQMPFLIGMFYLLKSSFPLRGAMFIPGWIDDLAAPDVLFSWGQPIWFIGNEFHLLPILMGVTMYFQQRLTSKVPKDASQLSDSQKQQKMMGNMMSVLFTVMFYSFPSGLNIYFMFSTLLGILQQWWIMQNKNKKATTIQKN